MIKKTTFLHSLLMLTNLLLLSVKSFSFGSKLLIGPPFGVSSFTPDLFFNIEDVLLVFDIGVDGGEWWNWWFGIFDFVRFVFDKFDRVFRTWNVVLILLQLIGVIKILLWLILLHHHIVLTINNHFTF